MTGFYAVGEVATGSAAVLSVAGTASPTGLQVQTAVSQSFATGGASFAPVGVSAIVLNGTSLAKGAALASISGNQGTVSIGQVAVMGASIGMITPVGISAVSNIGTPSASGAAVIPVAGSGANAFVQQASALGQADTTPVGVTAYTFVGAPTALGTSTATYRALILSGKYLKQISDAEVNTGLKPVVLFEGAQQPRKENEGVPIVLIDGNLHTLPNGANLIL